MISVDFRIFSLIIVGVLSWNCETDILLTVSLLRGDKSGHAFCFFHWAGCSSHPSRPLWRNTSPVTSFHFNDFCPNLPKACCWAAMTISDISTLPVPVYICPLSLFHCNSLLYSVKFASPFYLFLFTIYYIPNFDMKSNSKFNNVQMHIY